MTTSTIAETVVFLSRSLAVSILFKASILLALGLVAAFLAGRSRAALRHIVLAATFGTLIILPLAAVSGPKLLVEIPISGVSELLAPGVALPSSSGASPFATSNAGSFGATAVGSRLPSWKLVGGLIWLAGAVIFMLPLGVNLSWQRSLRRDGLPWPEMQRQVASLRAKCGVHRPVEVLLHEEIEAPMMCGFWRPSILLPWKVRDWSNKELRCAVVHELEHVRRSDCATQLVARAICACYWFHPLVWIALGRLCLEAERACDDAVIENEESTGYAEQLLSLARRMSTHAQPALGMANRSDLAKRISAVLDATQRRGRAGLLTAAITLAAAGLVVFAIAPLDAVAQMHESQQSGLSAERRQAGRTTSLDRALYEAAESGDVSDIGRQLNAGANINCALAGDGSPLIGAARKGHLEAVRFLLDRSADPNMPVPGDGNPLITAARKGHTAVIALLLDRGARIDEVVPGDENAVVQASASGELGAVKLLVSRGAHVNARIWAQQSHLPGGGEWRSPLSMARKGRNEEVVAYLLSVGARQ